MATAAASAWAFSLGAAAPWSEKSPTLLGMTAPLLVLVVPLLDVGLAIARRFLRGQHIFAADRGHIHHKLLARGFLRGGLLLIYGICGLGAAASLLLTISHESNRGFVIILLCLAAWLGLQHLGYNEFSVTRRLFLGGTFRSVLSAQLALEAFEQEIQADSTLQSCCDLLCKTSPQFGFSGMAFSLGRVTRRWGTAKGWQTRIDFPGHGYINLWRESERRAEQQRRSFTSIASRASLTGSSATWRRSYRSSRWMSPALKRLRSKPSTGRPQSMGPLLLKAIAARPELSFQASN